MRRADTPCLLQLALCALPACAGVAPREALPPAAPSSVQTVEEDADERDDDAAAHFSTRDPIYFAAGPRGPANAKFQFSFQYRVLLPDEHAPGPPPFWRELYFGFTTTSLWNLEADSKPFLDSVYRPSFHWRRGRIDSWSSDELGFGAEIGLEHASNGQAGLDSRSLNRLYIEPQWSWRLARERHLELRPKAWIYVGSLEDNPDIAEYLGHLSLELAVYEEQGLGLSSELRVGDELDRASLQLDLSYPLSRLVEEFDAYLQLQLFTGWGETLATYDQRNPTQVRLGLMLVR